MAKLTGSTKAQKPHDNSNRTISDESDASSAEIIEPVEAKTRAKDAAVEDDSSTKSSKAVTLSKSTEPKVSKLNRAAFDVGAMTDLGSEFSKNLRSSADAFEAAGRNWMVLAEQLARAGSELDRLGAVEIEHGRVAELYAGEKTANETLQGELNDVRGREAAARDKAAKFEEICETLKQHALEIHNALQESRGKEEKSQQELTSIQSELTELRRVAQEEGAARVNADDRNTQLLAQVARLETDESEVRARLAKLVEDNRQMATQVPKLLADRDNWQKQFSASERENARMQADRKVTQERIADLENEIRTLREDLAPSTSSQSVPSQSLLGTSEIAASPAETETSLEDDDLDLVASLDRAFSDEGLGDLAEPEKKSGRGA